MRWMKPGLRNTISALLGSEIRKDSPEALEPVRKAMLAALGDEGAEMNPRLKHRLMYLHDAHALWFARSEMVAVLSQPARRSQGGGHGHRFVAGVPGAAAQEHDGFMPHAPLTPPLPGHIDNSRPWAAVCFGACGVDAQPQNSKASRSCTSRSTW